MKNKILLKHRIFDVCNDIPSDFRLDEVQPLTLDAKKGKTYEIAVECYAGHKLLGTRPYENGEVDKWSFYSANFVRTFYSFDIVECDESVIKPAYELNYPVLVFDGEVSKDTYNKLLCVDVDNVIIESIKPAEDGNGFIARIYETEGCYTICNLSFNSQLEYVFKTDMLEFNDEALETNNNSIKLNFKPFEIKTLRFVK